MRRIGLTGSIGSGKSTVAAMLRELGVVVLDADAYAREGTTVLQGEICVAFPEVCRTTGIDRAALSRRVFSDVDARKRLEAILHPYVRRRMAEEGQKALQAGAPLVVEDIPLLFETGGEARFDGVLVVVAPEALRQQRVQARNGLSEAEFRARDAAQMPQAEKIARATWVLHNDGDLEQLRAQVRAWYKQVA
ncbi:MAG: dephospho-CoA kinase [Thermaceae bacterium]|nr:dephospho-CoA kinase [Thermaceae bacterium]